MGLISRVSSRTYRDQKREKFIKKMVYFKLRRGEGKVWLAASIISLVSGVTYVYYDEKKTKERMTAGLLRDQERIQRKKAQKLQQVREQEDLYKKQKRGFIFFFFFKKKKKKKKKK